VDYINGTDVKLVNRLQKMLTCTSLLQEQVEHVHKYNEQHIWSLSAISYLILFLFLLLICHVN